MKVIIISGPTASGKTDLAIELALKFGGEIVNFDSLLLYKELNIGTAKPSLQERALVPHHMVDVRSISHPMNAADYAREAFPIVENLLKKSTNVFLVGGSGFYLQALVKGMYDSPTTSDEIIKRSNDLYESEGIKPFLEFLQTHDLQSFERYHANDHYRIRRAVEHYWNTGTPLSLARTQKDETNEKLNRPSIHDWEILHIYLDLPKDEHAHIISSRTEKMINSGLIDEVKDLLNQNFNGDEKPLLSIGYKETLDFLEGKIDKEELKERIIISTRQLAKSQRTWFKRDQFKLCYHPLADRSKIYLQVNDFINKN